LRVAAIASRGALKRLNANSLSRASVAAVKPGWLMRPTHPGKLGETVSKVAERDAGHDSENVKCSHSDARTGIDAVQKEHQPCNCCGGNRE